MLARNPFQTLYDTDFNLWLETTANLLRERKLEYLDYENLIEEIEGMGQSQKSALESNLIILLLHLLKWYYQQQKRSASWVFTIADHNLRIHKTFQKNPSLKRYFEEVFDECYRDAVRLATKETGLKPDTFPVQCPFSIERVLDFDSLPTWGEEKSAGDE
jgi:hypothetical protein